MGARPGRDLFGLLWDADIVFPSLGHNPLHRRREEEPVACVAPAGGDGGVG